MSFPFSSGRVGSRLQRRPLTVCFLDLALQSSNSDRIVSSLSPLFSSFFLFVLLAPLVCPRTLSLPSPLIPYIGLHLIPPISVCIFYARLLHPSSLLSFYPVFPLCIISIVLVIPDCYIHRFPPSLLDILPGPVLSSKLAPFGPLGVLQAGSTQGFSRW